MFRGIHDRIALYKLNRRVKKLAADQERVRSESKEKKDPNILVEWWKATALQEYDDIEWARKRIVSDSLIKEADELHLPRPQYGEGDKWEADKPMMAVGYALTREAMVELRTAIRNERRARRETVEWWVKIIGGLITIVTGLVGALIGLISVWKHR